MRLREWYVIVAEWVSKSPWVPVHETYLETLGREGEYEGIEMGFWESICFV